MIPQDVWLRTEWLSSRKNNALRYVERCCAVSASEYRRARRRLEKVEESMAQVGTEKNSPCPQPVADTRPAEIEALNRRLAAANAEIRRYQTRLFACERELVALRQENAELEALCEQARKNQLIPPKKSPPQLLDQPGVPVIQFQPRQESSAAPAADAPMEAELRIEPEPEESHLEAMLGREPEPQKETWKPQTKLEHLSVDIVRELERLMG